MEIKILVIAECFIFAALSAHATFSSHWLLETDSSELAGSHFFRQTIEAEFASAAQAAEATFSFRELPPGMEMSISARGDDTDSRHFANVQALDAAGAKGTFYLNALNKDFVEKTIREILDRGSSVGGHTSSHPSLPKLNANAIFEEILGNRIAIETAANTCVNAFTLPFCQWRSAENPSVSHAIGEALRRAGYLGGGDILVDPAASYGLPYGSFVGTLQFSYDDRNPSPELFEKGIGKAEKRFLEGDFPPCGPHVTMGMHSWAKAEGMKNVTRAFMTRTRNPDAPFAGRIWFCSENEFIAAWMQKNHSRVLATEMNGAKVRWTILRPDSAGLGANVPLSVQIAPPPNALRADGVEVGVSALGQTEIPAPYGIPVLVYHVAMADTAGELVPTAKFPRLAAHLDIDLAVGIATLVLRNDGDESMRELRLVMRVPLAFDADVRCEPGSSLPASLAPGASCALRMALKFVHHTPWYCDGAALFDGELDFLLGDKPCRLHVTRRMPLNEPSRRISNDL